MKIIITGSTGMIGKGVLLECLDSPDITQVIVINRRSINHPHPKLTEVIHSDLMDLEPIKDQFKDIDACFFCVGVTVSTLSEKQYRHVTIDMSLNFAKTLLKSSPNAIFTYISGQGVDKSSLMPMRVKREAEIELLKLPFKHAVMFRPGYIQPQRGTKPGTFLYGVFYTVFSPFYAIIKRIIPGFVTSTTQIGQAMIQVAKGKTVKKYLESPEINALSGIK